MMLSRQANTIRIRLALFFHSLGMLLRGQIRISDQKNHVNCWSARGDNHLWRFFVFILFRSFDGCFTVVFTYLTLDLRLLWFNTCAASGCNTMVFKKIHL
jgi:hypothetical protein